MMILTPNDNTDLFWSVLNKVSIKKQNIYFTQRFLSILNKNFLVLRLSLLKNYKAKKHDHKEVSKSWV